MKARAMGLKLTKECRLSFSKKGAFLPTVLPFSSVRSSPYKTKPNQTSCSTPQAVSPCKGICGSQSGVLIVLIDIFTLNPGWWGLLGASVRGSFRLIELTLRRAPSLLIFLSVSFSLLRSFFRGSFWVGESVGMGSK